MLMECLKNLISMGQVQVGKKCSLCKSMQAMCVELLYRLIIIGRVIV